MATAEQYRKQNKAIAGCYCRLSDDDDNDGTSISIETQAKILGDYCRDNDITVHSFYQDDGFTGTNFNRPDFMRMMNDAQSGLINTIIVKDLSRFGRNYVMVGNYMSVIFPEMGIRFIAIGDDVDSEKGNIDYDLMVPIKNVFNEYYPADCSRKTRQAFISKATNGEFIGSQAPYGLKKSPEDKHILEIDEATAPTVQWIFEMAAYQGYGYNKIARVLTEKKVMTPAAYQAIQSNREYKKNPFDWNLTSVYAMLSDQAYIGHLVSGRRRKLSFKSKKIVRKSEDEWIIVKDIFPALISQQLWDDAHKALDSRKRESKSGFVNIFAGLIKCDKCGYALGIANANGRSNYFVCNTYKKKGPERCSSHYISYNELYQAVLQDMRKVISAVRIDKQAFIDRILERCGDNKAKNQLDAEIKSLESKIAELERRFDLLYDDRINGILSDRKFKELSAKCEAEQDSTAERLNELKEQKKDNEMNIQGIESFTEIAERYGDIDELDREILNRLIDKIIIGDRVKDANQTVQKITVNYRFVGEV